MKHVRTFAVTALSAAVLAGGISLATATSAAADDSAVTGGAVDGNEETDDSGLTDAQVENARTIIAVGKGADLSEKAQKVAVMTAMQESSLRNIGDGDRDSAGLFQQRPSMEWGSSDELTDPVYAAKAFYGLNSASPNPGLIQVDDSMSMNPGDAAQEVQRSAHPDEYAKWEMLADDLVDDNEKVDPID